MFNTEEKRKAKADKYLADEKEASEIAIELIKTLRGKNKGVRHNASRKLLDAVRYETGYW